MTKTPDHMDRILAQWRRERPESRRGGDRGRSAGCSGRRTWPTKRCRTGSLHRTPAGLVRPARRVAPVGEALRAEPDDADGDDDAVLGRHDQAARSSGRGGPGRAPARPVGSAWHAHPPHAPREGRHRQGRRDTYQERRPLLAIALRVGSAHPRRLLRKLLAGLEPPSGSTASPSGVRTIPRVGPVAQPGLEQGAFNPRVAGSNPARPTSSDVGALRLRSPGCERS